MWKDNSNNSNTPKIRNGNDNNEMKMRNKQQNKRKYQISMNQIQFVRFCFSITNFQSNSVRMRCFAKLSLLLSFSSFVLDAVVHWTFPPACQLMLMFVHKCQYALQTAAGEICTKTKRIGICLSRTRHLFDAITLHSGRFRNIERGIVNSNPAINQISLQRAPRIFFADYRR